MNQYVVYSDDIEKLVAMGKVEERDGKYWYDGKPLRVERRPRDTTPPERPSSRPMNQHETRKARALARRYS